MQRTSICLTALILVGISSVLSVAGARQHDARSQDAERMESTNPLIATPEPGFLPRQPFTRSEPVTRPPRTEGRLVVKFGDAVRMRPDGQGGLYADSAFAIDEILTIIQRHDISFRSATGTSFEAIDDLLQSAQLRSGRMQPDLNGMMYVEGPEFALHGAAADLHASDLVEFVHWDEVKVGFGPDDDDLLLGGDPTGACCYNDNGLARCAVTTEPTCLDTLGGTYFGDGTACSADDLCEACCVNQNCNLVRETADCNAPGATPTDRGQVCGANICSTGTCCDFPAAGCNDDIVGWDCLDGGGDFAPGLTCADDDPCAAGTTGACCLPPFVPDACGVMSQADCYMLGGYYWGDDATCTFEDESGDILFTCDYLEYENGHPAQGDCFDLNGLPHPLCTINPGNLWTPDSPWPQFGLGDDGTCGDLVCDLYDSFCCDVQWDTYCARAAHQFCTNLGGNVCSVGFKGSCYDPNIGDGGCNDMTCCGIVTFADPGCGSTWDADCVQLALNLCGAGTGGCGDDTPNLRYTQLYKTADGYGAPSDVPTLLSGTIPTIDPPDNPDLGEIILPGFNGAGWDFESGGEAFTDLNGNGWWDVGEPFVDDDGDGIWDRPGGLYGFAETLLHDYGINNYLEFLGPGERPANMVRGEGTRVAVIDRAMFETHEDLNVTVEPGQTMIYLDEVTAPHHGTAVVGVINAQRHRQNGIRGMEGIAPYADLLFFPMTSVEDGAREMQAWAAMLQSLSPGDIICVPYGPTVDANAWEVGGTHLMLEVALSLGFIPVVAAGNAGTELGAAAGLTFSPIIVGASTPGAPYYRMVWGDGGSNYSTNTGGVDLRGWGANVATTGFGGLFAPDCGDGAGPDPTRMYTQSFGGTSAAAAQIAGLCASLQGLAKQIYGLPIITSQMKYAFGVHQAAFDPPSRLFGEGGGQWLDTEAGTGRYIGRTIDLVGSIDSATSHLLNLEDAAFDGSPGLSNVWVMRGDKLIGSRFSLKANEENYLVARSEYTDRDDSPGQQAQQNPDFPMPAHILRIVDELIYLANAQTTDYLFHFEVEATRVEELSVTFNILPGALTEQLFHVMEFYDWASERWVIQRVSLWPSPAFIPDPPDYIWNVNSILGNGSPYLSNRGEFVGRLQVIGFLGDLGGNGGDNDPDQFDHRIDQITLTLDGGAPGFGQLNQGGGLQPPIPGP